MESSIKHTILLCGKKQSGKTTTASFIAAYYLTQKGIIPNANVDPEGKISIIYNAETNEGVMFDLDSNEDYMLEWMEEAVSPFICYTNFATALKETLVSLFGVDRKLVYGTNDDKNKPTHIKFSSFIHMLSEESQIKYIDRLDDFATVRELLELFGTDICREMDPLCHIRSAFNTLHNSKHSPAIGIIGDGRFDNEFIYAEENEPNTIKIKLSRSAFESDAPSEQGLPGIEDSRYDLVVPPDLTVAERNEFVINYLIKVGVVDKIGITKSVN